MAGRSVSTGFARGSSSSRTTLRRSDAPVLRTRGHRTAHRVPEREPQLPPGNARRPGVVGRDGDDRPGRVHRGDRAERLGEVDVPPPRGRARPADRWRRPDRRSLDARNERPRPLRGAPAEDRVRLPVLQPRSDAHACSRTSACRASSRATAPTTCGRGRPPARGGRARRAGAAPAGGALGRRDAARRDRPGAHHEPGDRAGGRAHREPRQRDRARHPGAPRRRRRPPDRRDRDPRRGSRADRAAPHPAARRAPRRADARAREPPRAVQLALLRAPQAAHGAGVLRDRARRRAVRRVGDGERRDRLVRRAHRPRPRRIGRVDRGPLPHGGDRRGSARPRAGRRRGNCGAHRPVVDHDGLEAAPRRCSSSASTS